MNTNAYTEYEYKDIGYYYPTDFTNRNKDYLLNQYRPSFTWNYGDQVHLNFYLDGLDSQFYSGWYDILENIDLYSKPLNYIAEFGSMFSNPFSVIPFMKIAESSIKNNILIEFYNWRFEKIYEIYTECYNYLDIYISSEISKKIFNKGIFYCSLKLLNSNKDTIRTLINNTNCSLYVN